MWEKIKAFFVEAWEWIKALPGKAWNTFKEWLDSIRRDRLYFFIGGLIVAAFFAITLKMTVCIIPVIFLGFIIEFIEQLKGGEWDWLNYLSIVLGGLLPQIFMILC